MRKTNNIREFTLEELEDVVTKFSEPKFRAKQIYEWLWKKHVLDFHKMSSLSKRLREKLSEEYEIPTLEVITTQRASDETIKVLFRLPDGNFVEGVIIPSDNRYTACISVQVGCSLSCKFCATGQLKLKRNLFFWEIYDQVRLLNEISLENFSHRLTNIVLMGMGEPLLNFRNTLKALELISDKNLYFGFSRRRITISTAGIVKKIRELGDKKLRYKLAISLHATTDEVRSRIMPINRVNDLSQLRDAIKYYYKNVRLPVTYEYVLLRGVNDTRDDIKRLARISRWVPSKVNLIEFNEVSGSGLEKSPYLDSFAKALHKEGVRVTVRRSRGKDIDAACGQLALKSRINSNL